MKKFIFALTAIVVFFLLLPQAGIVYAQTMCPTGFESLCTIQLTSAIGPIVSTLFVVAILLTMFFLLLGGIRWIMASGDKAKLDQARGTITHAIIGLVITFLSYFILTIVVYFVSGQTVGNLSIPKLVP